MEACYETLLTIYQIGKSDPLPETYLVTPHEIVLKNTTDWTSIEKHLHTLSAAGLILIKQFDKVAVSITAAGINKAKSLNNNFIADSFSFSFEKQRDIPMSIKNK